MATSIRDLITTLEHQSRYAPASPRQARDAAGALGELGRALRRLHDDGLDRTVNGPRERSAVELAQACTQNAAAVTTDPSGRLTRLAGGIADLIGVLRQESGREQRWAITAELARTARVLATHAVDAVEGDHRRTDELVWTHRSARTLIIHALQDTPSAPGGAMLDRAVPRPMLPTDLPASEAAVESLSVISHQLRRATVGLARRPTLQEVFAVTRAAQSVTRYSTTAAALLTAQPMPPARPVVAIWTEIRQRLQPFSTAAPLSIEDQDLGVWAQRTHNELRTEFGPPDQPDNASPDRNGLKITATRNLQAMINEIPAIADHLATAVQQLADHGQLHALAAKMSFREERLEAFLDRRAVIADRFDVISVIERLGDAATLAAELAVTLDSAAGPTTHQRQPDLLAVNTARAAAIRPDPHAALLHTTRSSEKAPAERIGDPLTAIEPTARPDDADHAMTPDGAQAPAIDADIEDAGIE